MEPVAALKEANKVIKREGIYKALSKEQASKILKDSEDWIFQRDPDDLYDYKKKRPFRDDPDFDPDDPDRNNFKGGGITRIGFKDGMTRRTFLKILSGAISIPIVGKFFKPAKIGKTVTKVPMIKTGDVPGKQEWFDSLVNKVILEGDDVTKNFATKDREIVHMKKIDDETSVTVTRDLDNDSIIVDIDDPVRNVMGESGDTNLMMRYKKGRADEETKGTPPDEFDVTEADMRNYMDGPDDYVTEFTENTVQNTKDLTSDLTKVKSYATGKKPTMKELVESKRRRDEVRFAEEKPAEYASQRGPDVDFSDYDDYDYASGGLAGMLGERPKYQMGGDVAYDATDSSIYGSSAITVTPDTVMGPGGNQIQDKMGKPGLPSLAPPGVEEFIVRRPGTPIQIDPKALYEAKGPYNRSAPVTRTIEERKKIAEDMNNASTGLMRNDGTRVNINYENIPEREDNMATMPIGKLEPLQPFEGKTFNKIPEQYRSGFSEYVKQNPIGPGGQAISYAKLPDGNQVQFGDTASAAAFRNYLKSIGVETPDNEPQLATQQLAPNYGDSPLASTVRTTMFRGGLAGMLGE